MEKLPNETLAEYFARLKELRGGSILGTGGMMDQPVVDPEVLGPTEQPLAEVVVQQAVQDPDDGDEYQPEKDTPEKAAARKQATLERQLAQTLGIGGTTNYQASRAAGMLGGPMFGLAATSLGAFADKFEKDAAALELGRRLGFDDVEKAKEEGRKYLESPDLARELLEKGGIGFDTTATQTLLDPKPKKSILSQFFGGLFGIDKEEETPTVTTPPPVYDSVSDMQMGQAGLMTDAQRRAGTEDFTRTAGTGKSVAEILAEQKAQREEEDNSDSTTTTASDNWMSSDESRYFI